MQILKYRFDFLDICILIETLKKLIGNFIFSQLHVIQKRENHIINYSCKIRNLQYMYTILCVELDLKRERKREIRKIKFWYSKLPYLEYHKDIEMTWNSKPVQFLFQTLWISQNFWLVFLLWGCKQRLGSTVLLPMSMFNIISWISWVFFF